MRVRKLSATDELKMLYVKMANPTAGRENAELA